jgi:hypothetical protein
MDRLFIPNSPGGKKLLPPGIIAEGSQYKRVEAARSNQKGRNPCPN